MFRRWILRRHTAARVIVVLRGQDEEISVGGWLEEVGRDGYLLRAPHLLHHDGAQPLDGELFIDRDRVLFVQIGGDWQ